MKQFSNFISSHIAILVLLVAALALAIPASFAWIRPSAINWLLCIIMCGMGLNLKLEDFKVVFSRPKDILIGTLAQFSIMPLLAYALVKAFSLPEELGIGIILVGCCPGGTSSNVITYLAKGDLALSVGMTGISTLLAPIMTPLLVYLLAGTSVDVDVVGMLISIVQVVILPICLGLIIGQYAPKVAEKISPALPGVSTMAIAAIVGCVISANASRVLDSSWVVLIAVILHNVCGYGLGYLLGTLIGLSRPKLTAVAVEVGMQNSGLATSLSTIHFAMYPMATLPGALFSVWHNFSGAMFANILNRTKNEKR